MSHIHSWTAIKRRTSFIVWVATRRELAPCSEPSSGQRATFPLRTLHRKYDSYCTRDWLKLEASSAVSRFVKESRTMRERKRLKLPREAKAEIKKHERIFCAHFNGVENGKTNCWRFRHECVWMGVRCIRVDAVTSNRRQFLVPRTPYTAWIKSSH